MENKELLEKIKKNSIGENKRDKYITTTKKISKALISTLFAVVFSVSMIACSNVNKNFDYESVESSFQEYNQNKEIDMSLVDQYLIAYRSRVYEYIVSSGIDNESIREGTTTIEDYKAVLDLSEDDLVFYYNLLGKQECEKVVQALGYKNWNDFLTRNNHLNELGNPEFKEWTNSEYREITKIMREEKVR
ncbi:MAG: hypothetical protein IKL65_05980 [Bacilli bacterium]|nr:hypothetical protein [Bacilli bacterium]